MAGSPNVLEFRWPDTTHRPAIEALELIGRYAAAGNLSYYPPVSHFPRVCATCGRDGLAGRQVRGENLVMPAEERKLATVLFADLVGSTELAADRDPERVRATLDRFYDAMPAEIERAGGTVEKFIGDAVMAVFGAPVAHEDDAERALHVALGMQRRLGELFGRRLGLRIGVNTGDVMLEALVL
jgi:class 3 adenylate cyclase